MEVATGVVEAVASTGAEVADSAAEEAASMTAVRSEAAPALGFVAEALVVAVLVVARDSTAASEVDRADSAADHRDFAEVPVAAFVAEASEVGAPEAGPLQQLAPR
jgi:hypothetical protein